MDVLTVERSLVTDQIWGLTCKHTGKVKTSKGSSGGNPQWNDSSHSCHYFHMYYSNKNKIEYFFIYRQWCGWVGSTGSSSEKTKIETFASATKGPVEQWMTMMELNSNYFDGFKLFIMQLKKIINFEGECNTTPDTHTKL